MSEENKQPKGVQLPPPDFNPFANLSYEDEVKSPVKSYNPHDPFDFRAPSTELVGTIEEILDVMQKLDIRLGEKSAKWEQLVAQAKTFGVALVEEK